MEAVREILLNFALQLVSSLGVVFLFGWLISVCNGKFYRNFGTGSRAVCYATGLVGTPIHEAAHALMCILFRHKITEIKFFQMNSADGTLGYVRHEYNSKSLYQRIGNLFIGIAPILVGSLVLCGLLYLLRPQLFREVYGELSQIDFVADAGRSFQRIFHALTALLAGAVAWQWWVFLIAGSFIALHMTLSLADLRGARSGVMCFAVLILAADIALYFLGVTSLTGAFLAFGSILLFFLLLFLIIALLLLLISFFIGRVQRRK